MTRNKPIIKIDRVKTVKEALELESLGVDFIVIQLSEDPRFTDNKVVPIEVAIDIKNSLKKAKLVGGFWIEDNYKDVLGIINKVGLRCVQSQSSLALSKDFRNELEKKGIEFIYSNIVASYEDDESGVLYRYKIVDRDFGSPMFYDVDLLGDMSSSRYFLNNESLLYKDELLQIEEIINITKNNPLLITLDFDTENIKKILEKIPEIKGISMTIVDSIPSKNDMHYFGYNEIIGILKKLNS